jgi:peptide chain release factor subunit 1
MITAEMVNRIVRFHGNGLPVVSLYGRIDPGASPREVHTRMLSLLDQVRPLAKDQALGHQARLSVRADIERIRAALGSRRWPPGAVAIFSCSGRDLYEEIPLPRPVREQVIVDETTFARPMLAVLGEYRHACVLVIDKASARVWEIDQDEMREVSTVRDPALRKPDYAAGLAETRVRNKAEELGKRHFRRVVKLLEELLRTDGYEIVVIGGHDYELPEFLQLLPVELRDRVAGTFSADPATAPPAEIRKSARSIVERYEREQEQRLISGVLEKAATGGPAALGLESCLQAGSVAAISTLLVHEGATVPGVVCDESGWLALSGDTCPICGNPTRRTPDVINELVAVVIDEGGSTRHIEAGTKLSEYLVAADLRFPLPPAPAVSS